MGEEQDLWCPWLVAQAWFQFSYLSSLENSELFGGFGSCSGDSSVVPLSWCLDCLGQSTFHSRSQNQRVLQVFVGLDQQTRSSSSTCTERKKSFHCRLLRKRCWLPAAHLSLQELSAVL